MVRNLNDAEVALNLQNCLAAVLIYLRNVSQLASRNQRETVVCKLITKLDQILQLKRSKKVLEW